MRSRLELLYYVFALVGLFATWYFNLQYFAAGGSVAPGPFFSAALANPLTTAITIDVYWTALVFSVWVIVERRAPASPMPWPYIALCFGLGIACALPLYLGRRERLRRETLISTPGG